MKIGCNNEVLGRTWVVVPMFNEESAIENVLRELRKFFPNILCIDDGSSDNSGEIAKMLGAVVLRHPINLGQGASLQTGFDFLKSLGSVDFVVTFDADGQHNPEDAVEMVGELISGGTEILFGTRFGLGDTEGLPRLKKFVLQSMVMIRRIATSSDLTDTHNGLRCFNRRVLHEIVILQNGMAHATEFESLARQRGWRYGEAPVTIRYSDYSKSKGQSILNGVNILFDLVWR